VPPRACIRSLYQHHARYHHSECGLHPGTHAVHSTERCASACLECVQQRQRIALPVVRAEGTRGIRRLLTALTANGAQCAAGTARAGDIFGFSMNSPNLSRSTLTLSVRVTEATLCRSRSKAGSTGL